MLDSMSVNIMNLPKTVVKFFSDYFQGISSEDFIFQVSILI